MNGSGELENDVCRAFLSRGGIDAYSRLVRSFFLSRKKRRKRNEK